MKETVEENTIIIKDLSKNYKMYSRKKDRLAELMFPWCKRHNVFSAVKNLNLDIKKGEILGILGKNGAGKSTLLKMVTGVVTPTTGTIKVNGKISSLLELGTAFNPELTGYENIYENGQVMGLTNQEIKEKEQEIIDFADIGEHLYQPVKTYSSGMFSRLAFACAMNVNPDILIVDEVLSVGDMAFQEKSITKMKEIREKGTTILFVSHSLPAVRNFCDRAIWMKDGEIVLDGKTDYVTEEYKRFMIDEPREAAIKVKIDRAKTERKKEASKSIKVAAASTDKNEYDIFEDININVKVENIKNIKKFGVGVLIQNSHGEIVSALNSIRYDKIFVEGNKEFNVKIKKNCFPAGNYYANISICDETIMFSYDILEYAVKFKVNVSKNSLGIPYVEGMCGCDYDINNI